MTPNKLPHVSQDTLGAPQGEFIENPNFIIDTYQRIRREQPELTGRVYDYIHQRATDYEDIKKMVETFVITYYLLETQVDADIMNEMFSAESPETL